MNPQVESTKPRDHPCEGWDLSTSALIIMAISSSINWYFLCFKIRVISLLCTTGHSKKEYPQHMKGKQFILQLLVHGSTHIYKQAQMYVTNSEWGEGPTILHQQSSEEPLLGCIRWWQWSDLIVTEEVAKSLK